MGPAKGRSEQEEEGRGWKDENALQEKSVMCGGEQGEVCWLIASLSEHLLLALMGDFLGQNLSICSVN